jgi:hypothetical protein
LLECNGSVDLERFVADLDKGRCFKFVPTSHRDVQDPTSKENGVITVTFQPCRRRRALNLLDYSPRVFSTTSINCCTSGATVEGSESRQSFSEVTEEFDSYGEPVIITLILVGEEQRARKLWNISGDAVYYEGKYLDGVESVMTSSAGTTILFLKKENVL